MIKELQLNHGQLVVVAFYTLYTDRIEPKLFEDLHKYACFTPSLEKTACRLFIHHVIYEVCEYIINKQSKSVIYFNFNDLIDSKTFDCFNTDQLTKIIAKILHVINKRLPVKVYISAFSFELFKILDKENKNLGIKIRDDILKLSERDVTSFTFDKIKHFVKKTELTFLDKNYFTQMRSKMLMLT